MAAPDPRVPVPVPVLREAARLAVEASSLRAVAREIGITPMALSDFINKERRRRHSRTIFKLEAWYKGIPEQTVRTVLTMLFQHFPQGTRADDTEELLAFYARLHHKQGLQPPSWIKDVRENAEDGDE